MGSEDSLRKLLRGTRNGRISAAFRIFATGSYFLLLFGSLWVGWMGWDLSTHKHGLIGVFFLVLAPFNLIVSVIGAIHMIMRLKSVMVKGHNVNLPFWLVTSVDEVLFALFTLIIPLIGAVYMIMPIENVRVKEHNRKPLPLFLLFIPTEERDRVSHDLNEEAECICLEYGKGQARLWLMKQIVLSQWPYLLQALRNALSSTRIAK